MNYENIDPFTPRLSLVFSFLVCNVHPRSALPSHLSVYTSVLRNERSADESPDFFDFRQYALERGKVRRKRKKGAKDSESE